jgi:hypothetical protein
MVVVVRVLAFACSLTTVLPVPSKRLSQARMGHTWHPEFTLLAMHACSASFETFRLLFDYIHFKCDVFSS